MDVIKGFGTSHRNIDVEYKGGYPVVCGVILGVSPGLREAGGMMARRGILGLIGSGVAAMLGGCGRLSSTYRYRYRITVEVETPQGLRTGSAVHEIAARENLIKLADGNTAWVSFEGEAFAVELGNGKTLFALVASSDPSEESLIPAVQSALDPHYRSGGLGNLATVKKLAGSGATQSATLAATRQVMGQVRPFYPLLVRFEDERNPKTVKEVKPDDLVAAFGQGFRLRKIAIETTGDAVTNGIVRRLPWLIDRGRPLEGTLSGKPPLSVIDGTVLGDNLNYRSFKREHI